MEVNENRGRLCRKKLQGKIRKKKNHQKEKDITGDVYKRQVVVGTGKIQGERLDIEITSLEYDGTIIPVELAVYDTDGQLSLIHI